MHREKLEVAAKELLKNDPTGHDIYHSMRVYNLAKEIAKKEGWQFDDDILFAIAMLHDAGHERSIRTGDKYRYKHMEYSAEIAKRVLAEVGFPEQKIPVVLQGILQHDQTKPWGLANRIPTDIKEILLIQDADNLEAIGILGMVRVLVFNIQAGTPLYKPELSLTKDLEKSRLESAIHNLIWHLSLGDNLNTKAAKKMVQERKIQARNFLDQFLKEWNGRID